MSNQIQPYNNPVQGHDWGRIIMYVALAYCLLPDALPGPLDDAGAVVLGLIVVGLMSLFGGAQ